MNAKYRMVISFILAYSPIVAMFIFLMMVYPFIKYHLAYVVICHFVMGFATAIIVWNCDVVFKKIDDFLKKVLDKNKVMG